MATTPNQTGTDKPRRESVKKQKRRKRSATTRNGNGRGNANGGMTTQLYRQGRDMVASAYDGATRAGSNLPKLARRMHLRSRGQSIYAAIEERPIVMGVVGLGVGMVIAALLPSMTRSHHNR
jgi:hypothetical protein